MNDAKKREANRVFAARKRALAKIPKQRTTSPLERWVDRAACAGLPLVWFFPFDKPGVNYDHRKTARAVAVCRTCPVMDQCRADAIERRDTWGVRGGLTPNELLKATGRTRNGK